MAPIKKKKSLGKSIGEKRIPSKPVRKMMTKKKTVKKSVKKIQTSKNTIQKSIILKKHSRKKHVLWHTKASKWYKKSIFSRIKRPVIRLPNPFAFIKRHKAFSFTLFFFFFVSCGVFYWFILRDLPSPRALVNQQVPQTTLIRDRNGEILFRIYKDANRVKLGWNDIPPIVKDATIAIEDANFYQHHGVSLHSIIRAFLYNLKQTDKNQFQGGSTITQQLVKNRLLGPQKSYMRKIKEVVLSPLVEFTYSKNDILTMYLNEVGYGGPAYGIEAASQMYFDKRASDLTLSQAAFLAGLPAAPTLFSPFGANPQFSVMRQQQVLDRMLSLKMISKNQYDQAKNEQLVFAPQKIDIQAPHFVFFVKDALVRTFGEKMVNEGGLDVTTTLDLSVQQKAEASEAKNIEALGPAYHITNAATLVTAPTTGEILAMVGSVNFFDTKNAGYVNVTNRPRQPGSSIKPVTYAAAFEQGFTPNTLIDDSPVVYTAPGSKEVYAPQNYDGKFHGTVTVRSALACSYNVPAVKTLYKIGVSSLVETGRKMGIESWNETPKAGLSLTLGGSEVTMLDMARAYGTIANMGVKKDLKFVKEIRDGQGNLVTDRFNLAQQDLNKLDQGKDQSPLIGKAEAEENQQVISPISAYWLIDIMSDNNARLPAFGPYAKLTVPNHKVAVKTGTTNNYRDNWTIGFTPDYLVAVWVGNNDGSFMNKNLVSGITGAAPIWQETMASLITDLPDKDFPRPNGLVPIKICAVNGLLTCPNCPSEKIDYFPVDKVPTKQCFFRPKAECDQARKDAEGKSDEEKKTILNGCYGVN
jgi:1A family penicillin-binding protein